MGRGAAAALADVPPVSALRHPRARLAQLMRPRDPSRSPLHHSPDGVAVASALRTGLLHNLRGAPTQDRNAVVAHPCVDVAMLSVFAGHGKHGSCLAELAATVVSRHVRRRLPRDAPAPAPAPALHKAYALFEHSLERIVDDAFVDANIAIDATPWSRNSGATATVCLVRKGQLVVGTCGQPCVMLATRKSGRVHIRLLSDMHRPDSAPEKERVERFGGRVKGESISDEEGRYVLPFTRSLGDLEMRSAGMCQVPAVRTFDLSAKDTHIIVSTQQLWAGASLVAPHVLSDVVSLHADDMLDLAEGLMKVAFGASGPTKDATILCAKLR